MSDSETEAITEGAMPPWKGEWATPEDVFTACLKGDPEASRIVDWMAGQTARETSEP